MQLDFQEHFMMTVDPFSHPVLLHHHLLCRDDGDDVRPQGSDGEEEEAAADVPVKRLELTVSAAPNVDTTGLIVHGNQAVSAGSVRRLQGKPELWTAASCRVRLAALARLAGEANPRS
jgi:hypothetical protein